MAAKNISRVRAAAASSVVVATLSLGLLQAAPSTAAETIPYGDKATAVVAGKLHGKDRGGWLATTLDDGGYYGRRRAELMKIAAGHGKRWVGVIHVPAGNADAARAALEGVYFAQRGGRFVVPLTTKYYTDGCTASACAKAARWASRRLGGWVVRQP